MNRNGNYFSGINGSLIEVSQYQKPGMGMKWWEWEELGMQKMYFHTSLLVGLVSSRRRFPLI